MNCVTVIRARTGMCTCVTRRIQPRTLRNNCDESARKKKNRDSLMCVPRMYVNTTTTGAHRSSLMNRIATIFSARVNTPTR